MKHIAPALKQKSFHCPNCGVLAEQTWTRSVAGNYLRTQLREHLTEMLPSSA